MASELKVYEESFLSCNLRLEDYWFEEDLKNRDSDWVCLWLKLAAVEGRIPFDTIIALDYPSNYPIVKPIDEMYDIEFESVYDSSFPAVAVVREGSGPEIETKIYCQKHVMKYPGSYMLYAVRKGHMKEFQRKLDESFASGE